MLLNEIVLLMDCVIVIECCDDVECKLLFLIGEFGKLVGICFVGILMGYEFMLFVFVLL